MIELLTTEQMARADRAAVTSGVPSIALMEAAGRAVADAAAAMLLSGGEIVVVCGPGNNGGDGFVAARLLAERGHDVRVLLLGQPSALKGDAAEAARRWAGAISVATPEGVAGAGLIIDALFGAGLTRPPEGQARALIETMNAAGVPILAVDLPSGIQGNTGGVMGGAVRATETVTFFRRKPGHLLLPARLHCGRVAVAGIGIPTSVFDSVRPNIFANTPELWRSIFPIPRIDGHKYSRGHAVVVSGGIASTGAARLAARAALRAGAGLVTIASPRDALAVNAANNLAVMIRPIDGAKELCEFLADQRLNAVVLGPGTGVGQGTRALVLGTLDSDRAVVLDADALTSFADRPATLTNAIKARKNAAAVLTPHQGEFTRLFSDVPEVFDAAGKLEKVLAAARYASAVAVLKGPDTVVAEPTGRAAIAENAPPWLATAGSGDVLAGIIAGLLAQGMPQFEATCAAVWLHGEAGNAVGPGLVSEDLPEALPQVLRHLFAASG